MPCVAGLFQSQATTAVTPRVVQVTMKKFTTADPDLRNGARTDPQPAIRESNRGVWLDGAPQDAANTADVLRLIERGYTDPRPYVITPCSPSHPVVTLALTQSRLYGSPCSPLHLVDLAGSERVGNTGAKGQTLKEAQSINQSLSALGNCMRALTSTRGKRAHIPYRDSKLTHLLRDSLGGNSKTSMVICLASDNANKDETISTLRFGARAKRIKCVVKVNKSGGGLSESGRRLSF